MTKEKILKAAIHQYSLHGYQGATMEKIASEAGIKPASIYFFFENKKALFQEAFELVLDDPMAKLKVTFKEIQDQPVEQVIRTLLNESIHYQRIHIVDTNAYVPLITATPIDIQPFLQNYILDLDDWIDDALFTLIKRDKPHITDTQALTITKHFTLLLDGLFWEIQLYDEVGLQKQIDHAVHVLDILLGGFEHEK